MKRLGPTLCAAFVLTAPAAAQEAPSFRKHVQPFFARYCVECHPAEAPDGGLSLHSYKGLLAGADRGSVFKPGKPDESLLVLVVEGKKGSRMPPRRARQPKKDEIAMLRAWVAAGAKDDSGGAGIALPS